MCTCDHVCVFFFCVLSWREFIEMVKKVLMCG